MAVINPSAEILSEIERRRLDLNIGLLRVYNYSRLFIGFSMIAVFSQKLLETRLGALLPDLFLEIAMLYTVFNLMSIVLVAVIPKRFFARQFSEFTLTAVDLAMLTALMYSSGGVASGIGTLMIVTVAAGAIIINGRLSTLIAALATIAVLLEEFYLAQSVPALHDDYFQAGVLGLLYFATSLITQNISARLRENDVRALTQAADLADLERINRQIIQRMRTGIVLVDGNSNVRMYNQSAQSLLGQVHEQTLIDLPQPLLERLSAWRIDNALRSPPFAIAGPEIRANFSPVRHAEPDGDVTVFLEDTSEVQQQAQQLKLAAIGRLSANIAHEIRNPLGAISHAAQLLKESANLDTADARLTEIIHNHCLRMNDVIENVLEMSRRKPPMPVLLNLKEHIDRFAREFIDIIPAAIVDTHVMPETTQVRMDLSQLSQILTNLAQNAVRHSNLASHENFVRLEGGVDEKSDRPYLNVIDHGDGVDADQVGNLFEPFFTTERSGTGLGLYISRELCESNQAHLNYFPHELGGSCFRITFAHPDRITA
ncbi:MAG: HAMP domain-containing sensor histidine kinase [Proteobacteria bacterium]|nr:HAMP domain-containing sensor histidine kinase [Pseudomonadota bacterium]